MSKKLFGKFFIFLLVVGLLFAAAPTGQAQAATLDVCPTCTYTTIQAAIDVAVDGDTISVGPGTYVGAIVINKPNLTIRSTAGADTTIIDANGAVMAVQLENNLGTVTFNGFSVTNFTDIGIAQSMSKPNTIFHVLNNKVVATGDFLRNGINVSGSGSTIIGNTVIGATYDNPSYGSSGIIVVNASNVLIQNNNISGTPEYGITINNWSNTTPMTGIVVSGNTITGADYGVLIWANDTFSIDGVTLTGNTITDYSAPVAVFGTVSNVTTLPPVANITSGDYFYTIQEAINAAANGDTIQVAAGTYVEDVVVTDKYFNLIGAVDTNGDPISVLEGSLFINNPSYSSPTNPEFSNIKNLYFERTDSHLLNLTNFNGGLIENCVFDGNNGFMDYQFNGINLVSGPNGNTNITVLNSTFKDGLYVGIGGYANGLTVTGSDFTNVKSGINMQGSGNLVVENSTFLTKPVSTTDSYGIRFASSAAAPNLTITGSTFTIDNSGGFVPDSGEYHSAIYIRSGATGIIDISDNTINAEVVNFSPVVNLDTIYGENTWPAGYGVFGNKITLPPTKLNMSLPTAATTDSCTGIYEAYVNVVDVTDLAAYTLNLTYDADLITVTKVENVGFVGGTAEPGNTFAGGNIKFGWSVLGGAGEPATITGDKSLIKITFQSKGLAGAAAFAIDAANSMLVHWDDVQPIPFAVTGGATFDFGAVVKNVQTTTEYCDLATAVGAATSGNELQFLADFTIPSRVQILSKNLTLDLNGRVATFNGTSHAIYVNGNGNTVTIKDTVGGGAIRANGATARGILLKWGNLVIESGNIQGEQVSVELMSSIGTMTLNGGTIGGEFDGTKYSGVFTYGGGKVIVNDGVIQSKDIAISGNGTNLTATTITINGGAINSDITGIYHPQPGTLNIYGGTITAPTAVEMRSGTLTITGGTIHGTGAYVAAPNLVGGYTTDAGDAIFVGTSAGTYAGNIQVNISGSPVITSDNNYALREAVHTDVTATNTKSITVTGGRLTGGTGAVTFSDLLVAANTAGTSDLDLLPGGAYNTDPGGTPDYVYAPYATYQSTVDSYYYIEEVLTGTIDAYTEYFLGIKDAGDGTFVDFLGEIPWYPADPAVNRTQGNRVAVKITEPTGGYDAAVATMTIGTKTWIWNDIRTTDGWVDVWQKIISVPQTVTVTMKWNNVSTQTLLINILEGSTLELPPAPVIGSTDIQGYYLVGDPQEFHVSLTNPDLGASYAHVIFKVSVTADAGDLSLKYWENTTSQFLDLPLTCDAGTCTTYYGPATGFPITPGYTANSLFELTAAVAGNYPFTITLLDLDTDPDNVLATYTNTGVVYPKPVITSTELAGPFQQGQGATVTINVDNVGAMYEPNSFILHLDLPEGTVVVYGGVTYTCTATGCDIPVTLAAGANAIDLAITFNAPYNAPITVTLVDTIPDPDRTLATFTTPANVVVYGNVASVTGTVSMQGRLTTAGVPVTLTGTLGFGPYTVPSVEGASRNLTFTDLVVGTYTITTNQPRYLNITADMAKVINIATDTDIAALRLRGGNAVYTDNEVNDTDLGMVSLGYTEGITLKPDADVNFDNKINIQDLALVGGNYLLTSDDAYADWQP